MILNKLGWNCRNTVSVLKYVVFTSWMWIGLSTSLEGTAMSYDTVDIAVYWMWIILDNSDESIATCWMWIGLDSTEEP
jgi:hypothetical protein